MAAIGVWVVLALYFLTRRTAVVDATIAMTAGEQVLSVEPNAELRLQSAFGTCTVTIAVPRRGIVGPSTSRVATEMTVIATRGRQSGAAMMRAEREVTVAAP